MKTKILTLLIAAMFFFNASFAKDTDPIVTETVLNRFSGKFEKASDVTWSKAADYYKATFTYNGQYLSAFYDETGESIAVSRNLLPSELPIILSKDLTEQYNDFWISDLFEYQTQYNSKYYITIETAKKKFILESIDNQYWSVFKKTGKF